MTFIFVFIEVRNLDIGVTLLHILTWENITVMRPVGVQDRRCRFPYVDRYRGILHYTRVGAMWFWQRVIDEMMFFTW